MLISKKWLQSYFTEELPDMGELAEKLLLHSFEIEGIQKIEDDEVLDIDVLPNRAHDCLSHEGIAKEVSTLFRLPLRDIKERFDAIPDSLRSDFSQNVLIENKKQCKRYIATPVKNIEVRESPVWLVSRLRAMGQKSINNLVDATNFILFDQGQPMHIFDADKVKGNIIVRNAREGEKMVSLTNEEIELEESDLVIADEEKVLALAGIKGGKAAEVDQNTKNIIIESANFDPVSIRKTSRRVKILTDASKRYENGISSEKAMRASESLLSLILELVGTDSTLFGRARDLYPQFEEEYQLSFTREKTAQVLGFDIRDEDIQDILNALRYRYIFHDGIYTVSIPFERLDLRIPEDMIEEIGRIYGYHMIPTKSVEEIASDAEADPYFVLTQEMRNFFVERGFFELMNYSFVKKGDLELLNPFASDKRALRKNLKKQMGEALEKNAHIFDFFSGDQLKIFEIDIVHPRKEEFPMLSFAIHQRSKRAKKNYGNVQSQIQRILNELTEHFDLEEIEHRVDDKNTSVVEIPLSQFLESGERKTHLVQLLSLQTYGEGDRFGGISPYPYIRRDVSFWIEGKTEGELEEAFSQLGLQFLRKIFLFDRFEKDGRISYAFAFIFQANDRTLSDKDVEKEMEKVFAFLSDLSAEVR